ncbi:hypothetical protein AHMF7605_06960 [Adhaeribacter arboris]|uniref:Luciferase-like domain-containing protein n=1 Tax=Adhaeribacter arboris TaxID=2072846 RepID=A0A2T2YCQ3_9BACT|nr:LLM class flavin-dependent oxidoreductase [Adhaeribacter arboris]PSR53289.1 hypothetical protein AHMF7605_06960 [Adhaeribacter arboris]
MKFGIHYLLSCSPEQSPVQRYQDSIEQAVLAESLGFESVWPVEQHFNQTMSAMPCPTLLLAAIAARTKSLRLGTAIIQLGLNHPLRVAEEIATLDVLSKGRVEFGVGRGSNPSHFAGFNISLTESRERLEESLAYVQKAFSEEKFTFQGKFFSGEDICLVPKSVQRPSPPITLAANSMDTARLAGKLGLPIVMALHINPLPKAKELITIYKNALQEAGQSTKNKISLLVPLFVDETEEKVRRAAEPAVKHFTYVTSLLLSSQANKWTNPTEKQQMQVLLERIGKTTYDSMNQNMAVFGTPSYCREKLQELEELGVERIICWFNLVGAIAPNQVVRNLELFSEEVMPYFGEPVLATV